MSFDLTDDEVWAIRTALKFALDSGHDPIAQGLDADELEALTRKFSAIEVWRTRREYVGGGRWLYNGREILVEEDGYSLVVSTGTSRSGPAVSPLAPCEAPTPHHGGTHMAKSPIGPDAVREAEAEGRTLRPHARS